jgi:hypothetical protein
LLYPPKLLPAPVEYACWALANGNGEVTKAKTMMS